MILALALAYALLVILGAVVYCKVTEECRRHSLMSRRPKGRAERTEREWDMIERLRKFNTPEE